MCAYRYEKRETERDRESDGLTSTGGGVIIVMNEAIGSVRSRNLKIEKRDLKRDRERVSVCVHKQRERRERREMRRE